MNNKKQRSLGLNVTPRTSFKRAQGKLYGENWPLPVELFGQMNANGRVAVNEMIDFEMMDYIHFLDHVMSLPDLIRGLQILSPFADDALSVAETMSASDFEEFKEGLPRERIAAKTGGLSDMPEKYWPILLPRQFTVGMIVGKTAGTSLSVTLIRKMEIERETKSR